MKHLVWAIVWVLCLPCFAGDTAFGQPAPSADGIAALLSRLEQTLRQGQPERYLELVSGVADEAAALEFAKANILPNTTRAVIRERDRTDLAGTLPGDGYQLLVEVFVENGMRARLGTWRLDVRRRGRASEEWGIAYQSVLTTLAGLHHLSLNPRRQLVFKDLVISAEDLRLTVSEGSMFAAESDAGATALVVLGRGDMVFAPNSRTERGQLRLYAGADTLQTPVDAVFIRLNPSDLDAHVSAKEMNEKASDPRDFKRAEEVFRQEIAKSFSLDLGDVSADTWSLLPNYGDFLAEIRTRRFDTLTYTKSANEVEDISLYDRKNRRNISVYLSREHLARYTRFYDEDERADYKVTSYDLDVAFTPQRPWLEGTAKLSIEITGRAISALTMRLAEALSVQSVVTTEFGRLLCVRVRNQNSVVVNLPAPIGKGARLTMLVKYSGALPAQPIDRESIGQINQDQTLSETDTLPVEESYLYSNRSYWYPQTPATEYATGTMTIVVPERYGCVASGEVVSTVMVPDTEGRGARRRCSFVVTQPARYFSCLIAPLTDARTEKVGLASVVQASRSVRPAGVYYDGLAFDVKTSPRLKSRGRDVARTAAGIIRYYTSLVGDCPYPSLTLAVVERRLPGGHSPAYMAVVSQPSPGSALRWADDPASFPDYPEFFVAHELAHQWWGQAVGWKNYHEQWLSEGFAQYFAALYAQQVRGRPVFDGIVRRMQHWAMQESDKGPVYLGYRIGHVKGDSRLFRAVVYNKSAIALDMLRRILGDKPFFDGIRLFYETWRFRKAGSDDLRRAFETESGTNLSRFFERWIYGEGIPQVTFTWRTEETANGSEAVLRFEQLGDVYDLPLTVTLDYLDKPAADMLVKLSDRVAELRVPLVGKLRKIDLNRDEASLVTIK